MMVKELELIFKAAKKIKKDYSYSNDGEAFAHLFVRNYLNIDDSEAAEACQVGFAGHDKGIDAFFVDEDAKNIFVFGITSKSKSFGPEILTDIDRAHNFLSSAEMERNVKDDLKETWISYKKWKKEEDFEVTYVRGVLGVLNNEARKMFAYLASELQKDGWAIEVTEKQDTINICLPTISVRGPDAEFEILDKQPLEIGPKGLPKAAVFSVRGSDLAEVVLKNRGKIFELNLRETLTQKNPVNKKIAESLSTADLQGYFWYLNLGVDVVCDQFTIGTHSQRKIDGVPCPSIKIKNFRIVNGCQTCITLTDNYTASAKVTVMVRLVETKDKELGYKIAVAKNRQTAIKERDLVTLNPEQLNIQADLKAFTPPFFYQRREGEWRSFKKPAARKFGKRMIDNKKCAKSFLATVLQKPFEAKHKTKIHFQQGEGGLYNTIFLSGLNNRDLVAADEVYSVVTEQNKKLRKEYRDLVKAHAKRAISDDEAGRLRTLSYLVNGDTYIAALIWHFIKSLKPKDVDDHLISLDRPLDATKKNNLIKLYEIACKPVDTVLGMAESMREDQEISFSVRNYFARTKTYKELLSNADKTDPDEISRAIGLK